MKRSIRDKAAALHISERHYYRLRRMDPQFAALLDEDASDEALTQYLAGKRYQSDSQQDATAMAKRRRFADMEYSEARAARKTIEASELRQTAIPIEDVVDATHHILALLAAGTATIAGQVSAATKRHGVGHEGCNALSGLAQDHVSKTLADLRGDVAKLTEVPA